MYTSTHRSGNVSIASLAILVTCMLATPFAPAEEPVVIFSPPGMGGALMPRGHFIQTDGAALYHAICQGCHMPDARGARGAGMYPALAANPKLASVAFPVLTVLQGRRGMPGFGDSLSDEQVAEVVNFVRSHFDNHFTDSVTSADVERLRASSTAGSR